MAAATSANQDVPPAADASPPTQWDEAKLRSSLASLEQLQDQIDALRSVIPSITSAAATRNPSKKAYFANFQKVAVSGSQQVNDFTKDWLSPETQSLLQRARKQKAEDPNMARAADVPKYGWVENKDQEV